MTLPNFMIVGSARCGTTSLYYYLKQHPKIGFPEKKEPKYFSSLGMDFPHRGIGDSSVDEGIIRDWEAYKGLFHGLDGFARIGEASSDYLYFHQHSARAIREAIGDIHILIVLRDPAERAYSAYNNLLRDQREKLSFAEALEAEEGRMAQNWDWMWAYKSGGLYAAQVETFQKTFSRVKVVLFENLIRDTQSEVKDILEFLGVDKSVPINTGKRYSHSGNSNSVILRWLMQRENPLAFSIRKTLLSVFPRSFLESLAGSVLQKKAMGKTELAYLRAYFSDDIKKLERLIKQDLSSWMGPV